MTPDLVTQVFMPHVVERGMAVKEANGRFVYYSTAETALSIIQSQEIWMRNTATMNDWSEVRYGLDLVVGAYGSEQGKRLRSAVDEVLPGVIGAVERRFNAWAPHMQSGTFITCVSEHDPSEDSTGRLSMWRAYGGRSGVALVFNNAPFFLETQEMGVYSSPVAYYQGPRLVTEFGRIADAVVSNAAALRALGQEEVEHAVLNMLVFAALSLKHPGFREEREWRIVAIPNMFGQKMLKDRLAVVRGVPQQVLRISLEDRPEKGVVGLTIPALLNRVIIGPCEYPAVIADALQRALEAVGVTDAAGRIYASDIPLRHD